MGPRGAALNSVELLLQHRGELDLADSQVVAITAVKARLDSLDGALMQKLDSLRAQAPAAPPGSDSRWSERRDQFRDIVSQLRKNNDEARKQAMALLTPHQRKLAQGIEDEARKQLEENRPMHRGGRGYGGGRRGGD
jgi:Spy/CpxP family protein refolding chaperone